jgi:hypothetical protein
MRQAERHGLEEMQPRIALNIARGSLSANRAKYGLAVLSRFESRFTRRIDAHHYLGTLAELQFKAGQTSKALATWRASKRHAESLGDLEHARYCERHEASVQAAIEAAGRTERSLRAAMARERASDRRVELLTQLVEVLLRRKKTKAARKAFDEAIRLCTESRLGSRKRELYMTVANHGLFGRPSEQLDALKAYVMAMVAALETEPDSVTELASRITFTLAGHDSPIGAEQLRSLIIDLKSALATELPAGDAARVLLWPFDLAARLARFRNHPEKMQQATVRFASAQNVRHYLRTGRFTVSRSTRHRTVRRSTERAVTCPL